jgi:hypothetical protein
VPKAKADELRPEEKLYPIQVKQKEKLGRPDVDAFEAMMMREEVATPSNHPRDPLHGVTLETIVRCLVERHGWEVMGSRIPIRCFLLDPSVKSSLTFLRKTPWARKKVEDWFAKEATELPPEARAG